VRHAAPITSRSAACWPLTRTAAPSPGVGEPRLPGQTYGSLSNLILSLTAVVWNSAQSQYVLKTFQRSDPDIRPFLAHLGRAFITQVTLRWW
jgi:hypothetical protein